MNPKYLREDRRYILDVLSDKPSLIDPNKSLDELTPGELLMISEDPYDLEMWQRERRKRLKKADKEISEGYLIRQMYGSR